LLFHLALTALFCVFSFITLVWITEKDLFKDVNYLNVVDFIKETRF